MFVIPRKYIVGTECLQIIRIVGRKEISYNNIDGILRKEGKVSLETPSMQQLWLMKGDRVLAQLSPIKLEECEEEIIRQINIWRIKNQ